MEILQSEPLLLLGLSILGLCVGFLTGLFGIGGAFISTPIMILVFEIAPSTAVGCSMGFTLVNGALGLWRHKGTDNFEPKAIWPFAIGASVGTIFGFLFHHQLAKAWGDNFDTVVNIMFCIVLIPIGLAIWWRRDEQPGKSLLSKLHIPPMIQLGQAGIPPVSLPLLAIAGLAIGVLKGMLGIGGGILLVPFLVLVVGLSLHRSVGTSLGIVLVSSTVGTILFAFNGNIDLLIVVVMLAGSLIGVVLGSKSCNIMSPIRLRQLLVTLIFCFSAYLAIQVWNDVGNFTEQSDENTQVIETR